MRYPRLFFATILALVSLLSAHARAAGEVTVSAQASRTSASPGDQLVIAVILDHKEHWHTQADEEQHKKSGSKLAAVNTKIEPTGAAGFQFGPVQWPKAVLVSAGALGDPSDVIAVFEGRAVAYVPVVVSPTAALGKSTVTVTVSYQACDDKTCAFPTSDTIDVSLDIVATGSAGASAAAPDPATFAGFDNSIFSKMISGQVNLTKLFKFNLFGRTYTIDTRGIGLLLLLLLAVLGGFVLNLTPCVLPVIPIKIMSLQHSAGTARRRILLGSVMAVGVVAFWIAIGLAMAFLKWFSAANQLFQNPYFTLGMGVLIGAMAVGMFGLFAVKLPDWVYAIDPKRESIVGSFLFGIMTAVLATPCIAPFGGAAMAWATKQPIAILLMTFAAIGFGMSLPYLVLATYPQLVAKVPRTGPASDLVKQIMGILMLAVAVFFIGSGVDPLLRLPVDPAIRWHWWIVGGLVVGAGVWLVIRTWKIATHASQRGVWSVAALGLMTAGVWIGVALSSSGPIKWIGYTPERLAAAQKAGKVVVLDFTAEWCNNCKALEHFVLHREPIVKMFQSERVVAMKVDLTGKNEPGVAKLKELNWVGIPLLAFYGPAQSEPLKYDTYTVQTVLDAVAKVGGKPAPSGTSANPR
jgi:thiol:disulfide interchange protein